MSRDHIKIVVKRKQLGNIRIPVAITSDAAPEDKSGNYNLFNICKIDGDKQIDLVKIKSSS